MGPFVSCDLEGASPQTMQNLIENGSESVPVAKSMNRSERTSALFQPETADIIFHKLLAPHRVGHRPVSYGLGAAKAKTVPASDPVMTAPFATVGDAYWKPVSVV
jgi:hypothetical protein